MPVAGSEWPKRHHRGHREHRGVRPKKRTDWRSSLRSKMLEQGGKGGQFEEVAAFGRGIDGVVFEDPGAGVVDVNGVQA